MSLQLQFGRLFWRLKLLAITCYHYWRTIVIARYSSNLHYWVSCFGLPWPSSESQGISDLHALTNTLGGRRASHGSPVAAGFPRASHACLLRVPLCTCNLPAPQVVWPPWLMWHFGSSWLVTSQSTFRYGPKLIPTGTIGLKVLHPFIGIPNHLVSPSKNHGLAVAGNVCG